MRGRHRLTAMLTRRLDFATVNIARQTHGALGTWDLVVVIRQDEGPRSIVRWPLHRESLGKDRQDAVVRQRFRINQRAVASGAQPAEVLEQRAQRLVTQDDKRQAFAFVTCGAFVEPTSLLIFAGLVIVAVEDRLTRAHTLGVIVLGVPQDNPQEEPIERLQVVTGLVNNAPSDDLHRHKIKCARPLFAPQFHFLCVRGSSSFW